jgi:hypothetical protein
LVIVLGAQALVLPSR